MTVGGAQQEGLVGARAEAGVVAGGDLVEARADAVEEDAEFDAGVAGDVRAGCAAGA